MIIQSFVSDGKLTLDLIYSKRKDLEKAGVINYYWVCAKQPKIHSPAKIMRQQFTSLSTILSNTLCIQFLYQSLYALTGWQSVCKLSMHPVPQKGVPFLKALTPSVVLTADWNMPEGN